MEELTHKRPWPQTILLHCLGGVCFAVVTVGVATLLLMQMVPRTAENTRLIPAVPWLVYAWFPTAVAVGLGLSAALLVPRQRVHRLAFMLGLSLALAVAFWLSLDLLRRDYAGKL